MARARMARPRRRRRAASGKDGLRSDGQNLLSAVLLTLMVVAQATRTMDYRAKAPAEYDNSMFYDDETENADKETPPESETNPEYPDIKYKAIQAKPSVDADYEFKYTQTEPIRPKRQKMGRTKQQLPTKKPAHFKVKPEVLMAQYLHEPLEESEGRQRPGRWESKKDQSQKQSEDDYDYTAVKLQGEKSPEEIYDRHKDEYDDEYDRRSFDPRNDHLQFILQPSPKKQSRISVPSLPPSRWTLTRSTRQSTVQTPTRSTVQTTTHSTARQMKSSSGQATTYLSTTTSPTSLIVLPLTKPPEPSGYDATGNVPLQVNRAEDQAAQLHPDEPSKEVIPLDGLPFGPTKPPVFARMRPMDEGLPTMVLPNSERPDSLMVAEGMRHGPEVEGARYKIRNHLLSRGVDPDSDPDEIVCEYVEMDSSRSSSSRPDLVCLFLFGFVNSALNFDKLN